MRAPVFWRARGVRARAICEPVRRCTADSTASLRSVCKTLRNDVVEWAVRAARGRFDRIVV
eukprot:7976530-Lingulodinium_polyedra.AAC.1